MTTEKTKKTETAKTSAFSKLAGLQTLSTLNKKINSSGLDTMKNVPIDDVVSVDQVRKQFDNLEELAESIKQIGLQVPINVTRKNESGKYVIIQGERRWRACKLAGLKTIDVIVRNNPKDDPERMFLQLTENLQRSDMALFDIAEALSSIAATGLKNKEIAQRLGKSESFVTRSLQIARARPEIKALCQKANILDLISIANIIRMDEKNPEKTTSLLQAGIDQGKIFTRTYVNTLFDSMMLEDEVAPKKRNKTKKTVKTKASNRDTYLVPEGVKPVGKVVYVSKVGFTNPTTGEESEGYLSPDFICEDDFKVCVVHNKQLIPMLVQNLLYLGQAPITDFE